MSDDDTDGAPMFGPIPVPAGVFEAIQRGHEAAHMRAESREARIEHLLDTLDVEGLLALRLILNHGDQDSAWAMNQYYDGQVASILRRVHQVDPYTGEDPTQALLAAPPAPTEAPGDEGERSEGEWT